ncbi:asparagine synthase (glutamine-hydrolyzing) [Metasolibacillus sp.]|uniref:asparagine synthase (glutamine-hydrolyzing) n=1 Tax=Metasolibacillus sp. TaxID=2703680 RepID=UPI0025E01866|nr:asparagine synthase (glutamine-hydrolyzing) [Metasolibacillus sp.]MCT6923385.1 asparagine synthase (glutamine-hydrolyzing) [Metasolibacillus sp.]MCT6939892.1 asparagine synthase (glutamine-hydrolyzing) [Metasolibacillus sp.]
MCGIVGFINQNDHLKKSDLLDMLNKIQHRGPDNLSISIQNNVYLGHARLSIIDLNSSSNQPMEYEHYTIVFNGEIYNYKEIREKLQEEGHVFKTQGDTEVILHAYEQWGEKCQTFLRGMWAFVIYDKKNNILFGSRDRMGIKPLYFKKTDDYFSFASEIKPLLGLDENVKANMNVVSTYLLTNLMNFDNQTFFQDIYQLEGGTSFKFDISSGEFEVNRYYDLAESIKNKRESTTNDFNNVLDTSFEIHVQSDVQVGTCLSGGVDSSTVTAKVSSLLKKDKIKSITAKSISKETDESKFAKIVAEHLKIDWCVVEPNYEYFKTNIEECLYYQEEPVGGPSIFMQYAVMQEAKKQGIKVLMDGQGGDETLLGYERYYSWMLSDLIRKRKIKDFFTEFPKIVKNSKLGYIDLFKQYVYFNNFKLRVNHLKQRHTNMKEVYIDLAIANFKKLGYENKSLEELQILELTKTNLPTLLKNEDRNSMLASIEARVPFVDHEVIETALKLPLKDKINNGYTKFCLRKYLESMVPKTISWRRDKKGFEAPTDIWLKEHMEVMNKYINESSLLKEIYTVLPELNNISDKEVWKLYNLAVWEKQYLSK